MATLAATLGGGTRRDDVLTGTPRAKTIDRWIFVIMAGSFLLYTMFGFIPDSLAKIAALEAGQRPPFPLILHVHAVLMGSFLLLLFSQTWLMATGRRDSHKQLGMLGMVLAPTLVVVGFILIPTNYHLLWNFAQAAPAAEQPKVQQVVAIWENIMLLQIRIGILFSLFMAIGLSARLRDSGMHKRMMIIAVAMAMPASIDRIQWIPQTMPGSPLTVDIYTMLALSPMFLWDVIRNRYVHRAYWILAAAYLPLAIAIHALWDTPWWHSTARQLMGV
ncbi:hypothetical protein LZ518_08375 [Sphingomonas sp. RB56-2]|uniref:DUF2306 domain-containing protein n=1 Tax=Sphingomonas brevis TaxID=2908206 RepID=A0ABT0S9R4_9SPHN|nr:hypothetical protein [Sphingomonas brevis]MCL6741145.1 hypothetical protein [Sphingomonas brevis]